MGMTAFSSRGALDDDGEGFRAAVLGGGRAVDRHLVLPEIGVHRTDADLDLLGGGRVHTQALGAPDGADDDLVDVVATVAEGRAGGHGAHADDADVGRPGANVHDQVALDPRDRQASANGGGQHLWHHIRGPRAGRPEAGRQSVPLHAGRVERRADDSRRAEEQGAATEGLSDEVAQEIDGGVEVGEGAPTDGADNLHARHLALEHAPGFRAVAHRASAPSVKGHGRGFTHDHPRALDAHVRVRRTEIDADLLGPREQHS
jgi:hypothetical protein